MQIKLVIVVAAEEKILLLGDQKIDAENKNSEQGETLGNVSSLRECLAACLNVAA